MIARRSPFVEGEKRLATVNRLRVSIHLRQTCSTCVHKFFFVTWGSSVVVGPLKVTLILFGHLAKFGCSTSYHGIVIVGVYWRLTWAACLIFMTTKHAAHVKRQHTPTATCLIVMKFSSLCLCWRQASLQQTLVLTVRSLSCDVANWQVRLVDVHSLPENWTYLVLDCVRTAKLHEMSRLDYYCRFRHHSACFLC